MWKFALLLLLSGCASGVKNVSTQSPSPSPSVSPSPIPSDSPSASPARADSLIGKRDSIGNTTVTVDVPDLPECDQKYVTVNKEVFENCLIEGLTPIQVINVFGYQGEVASEAKGVQIRQWNGDKGGVVSVTFINGHLSSKSQVGLE